MQRGIEAIICFWSLLSVFLLTLGFHIIIAEVVCYTNYNSYVSHILQRQVVY